VAPSCYSCYTIMLLNCDEQMKRRHSTKAKSLFLVVPASKKAIEQNARMLSQSHHFDKIYARHHHLVKVTECLRHRWRRMCPVRHSQSLTQTRLSSFITCHRNNNMSTITGVSSGIRTAYHSGAPQCTPGFLWDSCCSFFKVSV